jgi:hypothetical protein
MSSLDLSAEESNRLTLALAESWRSKVDFEAREAIQQGQAPERLPAIREQIERSQALVLPFIGRIAIIRTTVPAVYEDNEWHEISMLGMRGGLILERVRGFIEGVEGHTVRTRSYEPSDADYRHVMPRSYTDDIFRIGIVLEAFGSETERVMVPIHDFPHSSDPNYFVNGIGR